MNLATQFSSQVRACEIRIGYTFRSKTLSAEALNSGLDTRQLRRNDCLAVYGDSAAQRVLCARWFESGGSKEAWTSLRNAMLSNDSLSATGFAKKLDVCIIRNRGTTEVSKKMMATAIEAILGAVHLDGGDDALASVMNHLGMMSSNNSEVTLSTPIPTCRMQIDSGLSTLIFPGLTAKASKSPLVEGPFDTSAVVPCGH